MIEIVRWKQDGTPKTCHMPCYLYDVFLPKAKDIGFLNLYHGKSEFTYVGSFEFLQPSVYFNTRKSDTINWKVVDLEGVFFYRVLPKELGIMVNLRYLNLRRTYLSVLPPFVANLPHLESLDFKHTYIDILPCSIWKANNLRHLYMNNVSIQKPSNQPPTNLQVLTGLNIGSMDPGIYGLDRCTNLRKLDLTCHSKSVLKTAKCISRLVNLHTLKLRSINLPSRPYLVSSDLSPIEDHQSLSNLELRGVIEDHRIGNLPRNLNILTLSRSGLREDPMRVLGKLPQLRVLNLFADSYLGQEMTCHADADFPELRVLKLWDLQKLELLTVENGAMPQLRELETRGCKKLRSSEGLDLLPVLKELILTNMPQDFVEDARRRLGNEKLFINNYSNTTHVIHDDSALEVWNKMQSLEGKTVKS